MHKNSEHIGKVMLNIVEALVILDEEDIFCNETSVISKHFRVDFYPNKDTIKVKGLYPYLDNELEIEPPMICLSSLLNAVDLAKEIIEVFIPQYQACVEKIGKSIDIEKQRIKNICCQRKQLDIGQYIAGVWYEEEFFEAYGKIRLLQGKGFLEVGGIPFDKTKEILTILRRPSC